MQLPSTDWTARWARYAPDRVAVSDGRQELTYGELERGGGALVQSLYGNGLRKGDRIAILAENDPLYFYLFVAAQKAGFVLVPVNYRLAPPEVAYVLEDADPALIFCQEAFYPLLASYGGPDSAVRSFPSWRSW